MTGIALVAAVIVLMGIYFLPTFVASARHHQQRGAIFVINLFLGWTFLVWVLALAWSCSHVTPSNA